MGGPVGTGTGAGSGEGSPTVPIASKTPCQFDVFWHEGYSLAVDAAEVSIIEEPDDESFSCLLQGHKRICPEEQVRLEILGNFSHHSSKRGHLDE